MNKPKLVDQVNLAILEGSLSPAKIAKQVKAPLSMVMHRLKIYRTNSAV